MPATRHHRSLALLSALCKNLCLFNSKVLTQKSGNLVSRPSPYKIVLFQLCIRQSFYVLCKWYRTISVSREQIKTEFLQNVSSVWVGDLDENHISFFSLSLLLTNLFSLEYATMMFSHQSNGQSRPCLMVTQ